MRTEVAVEQTYLPFWFAEFKLCGFCLLCKDFKPCWVYASSGEIQEHYWI